jgi:hypothetical protein
MNNYKQTSVTGESWIRAYHFSISNPQTGLKQINFQEEKVTVLDNGVNSGRVGEVLDEFTETGASTEFSLLNPKTGDVVGTANYDDLYNMLHSLYIHLAQKRDDAETTPSTE